MPITHVRFVHSKVPAGCVPTRYEDLEEDFFLLLDPVSEATKTGIGDMFRRLDPALTVSGNIIIRGVSPQLFEAIEGDAILKQEVGAKSAMALIGGTSSAAPGPQLVPIPGFNPVPRLPRLANLRQAELHDILERTNAIYTNASYHYALPSTYHADKFIRLGTALRSAHDVRRMVDWVLEYLKADTIVVADTGSLLPLLYSLREEAASRFGWKVEIATLDEYPSERSGLTDAVEAINNRPIIADMPEEERQYLFLISVSSSGHTCSLFKSLRLPNQTTLVFCQTPNTNPDSGPDVPADSCDAFLVTVPVHRFPVATDGMCQKCAETPAIHVHPVSYELLPTLQWEPVVIGKELGEKTRWFWEIASEVDAVRLHDYAPYSGRVDTKTRHFSVYLDPAKLAAHAVFRQRCLTRLRSIPAPNVVLIPEHQNTDVVRALCEEAYGALPTGIVSTVRLTQEHERLLRGTERVLVADDAIVTGTTLVNLRGEVFRVTQDLGCSPEVNAFVLVSRPANRRPLQQIRRRYLGQEVKEIVRGAEVFLPDDQRCPWCEELRTLRRYAEHLSGKSQELAVARIRRLDGFMSPPLLMVDERSARPDLITHGSIFGELRHTAAFAAGSSAAQTLKLNLGSVGGGIKFAVADIPMAIDAYYEGPLLAALLRTFDRVEIHYPGGDPKIEERIAAINPNQAYPGVLAELTLAAIAGKIPGRVLRRQLEDWKTNDEWLQMLADIFDIATRT